MNKNKNQWSTKSKEYKFNMAKPIVSPVALMKKQETNISLNKTLNIFVDLKTHLESN